MHPVQYTVLDYAYRADYSCTVTMHVQKIQKIAPLPIVSTSVVPHSRTAVLVEPQQMLISAAPAAAADDDSQADRRPPPPAAGRDCKVTSNIEVTSSTVTD